MSAFRPRGGRRAGRAGLVFPMLMVALATYLLVGQLSMQITPDLDPPGPRFFPAIVIAALYILAALLTISLLRSPQPPVEDVDIETRGAVHPRSSTSDSWFSDWPRLAWAVGGFAGFILLLEPAGWIIAGATLFWSTTKALDSRHPIRDIAVSFVFSSVLYLIFAGLLSVNLPSGLIFGGGL